MAFKPELGFVTQAGVLVKRNTLDSLSSSVGMDNGNDSMPPDLMALPGGSIFIFKQHPVSYQTNFLV